MTKPPSMAILYHFLYKNKYLMDTIAVSCECRGGYISLQLTSLQILVLVIKLLYFFKITAIIFDTVIF